MRIFIEPVDPLLFRTGRPFQAGEDNFAETLFPPTPETLQGALRSALAVQWGETRKQPLRDLNQIFQDRDLKRIIGIFNDYGMLRITGITLGRRDPQTRRVERLFPAPAHLEHGIFATSDGQKSRQIVRLRPEPMEAMDMTNLPPGCVPLLPDQRGLQMVEKSEAFTEWLTPRGLETILQNDSFQDGDATCMVSTRHIYTVESRLGIGMNNDTNTTKEGYLYQMQMVRMHQDYGFVVDIEFGEEGNGTSPQPVSEQRSEKVSALSFLKQGWMTLGGEQRAAHFEILASEECVSEPAMKNRHMGNFLYFATPAYFSSGWISDAAGMFPIRPIAAAIPRYESIGGWKLMPGGSGGQNKAMRRCIPAGSVYFFDRRIEITQPITEYGWQIGYGITYIGEWNKQ
ncbi:type III-B CRISPR module-associated protein Cmr3 [Dictyobacter arantiisoli]|uniref:Type III-B CRISPR module-associated protein Cmr3 n=1 Tax=Dictyobacter arantiisoli TaxID=2014874 RepID=A0A5A5TKV1_9CHLR|nr:type III-B CRISPR module-associated protein Cmr3 [Dictyobacter arantiisoli]GCF11709.1 type III-B CRISPR module-associated protein Cmr3 [Dictyobacter arantiisoli]